MEEIYEIELHMKRQNIGKTELAELTGFTMSQLRRMFKGDMTVKELTKIKSVLNLH